MTTEHDSVDRMLKNVSTSVARETQVLKVLKAFKLDPLHILQLPHKLPLVTEQAVKQAYKKLSLQVHPDKCSHSRAREAFDLLKSAELDLTNPQKRNMLTQLLEEALFKLKKVHQLQKNEFWPGGKQEWECMVQAKLKEILIEEELRKRKAVQRELELEGEMRRKLEEEEDEKKRKREEDKAWEQTRDSRVNSWRTFQNKQTRKKRKTLPNQVEA